MKRVMKKVHLIIAALLLVGQGTVTAKAGKGSVQQVVGVVSHVSDGDTLWVKPSNGGEALDVRVQGIDAPESCQDYGQTAKQALTQMVLHKTVTLKTRARDKYGRVVANVSVSGQDVGAVMVAGGHAWSYHFHKSAGPYAREEAAARQAGRGLWGSSSALEPREFRKRTKCHKPRK